MKNEHEHEKHELDAGLIRAVRLGHGANCSSIGSLIDTLFATAVVGGAVFAAIATAMAREDVRVVGEQDNAGSAKSQEKRDAPHARDEAKR